MWYWTSAPAELGGEIQCLTKSSPCAGPSAGAEVAHLTEVASLVPSRVIIIIIIIIIIMIIVIIISIRFLVLSLLLLSLVLSLLLLLLSIRINEGHRLEDGAWPLPRRAAAPPLLLSLLSSLL